MALLRYGVVVYSLCLLPVTLGAAPAGVPDHRVARPPVAAPASAPARAEVAEVRKQIEELRMGLAKLDSHLDQVKDLHIRLVRLAQVVDRLERAAQAPGDLDRKIRKLRRDLRELARRAEEGRLEMAGVRAFARAGAHRGQGGAGYHGGFYLASSSGRYRLQVNGLLQTRLQLGQVSGPTALTPEEPVHLLGFDLPTGLLMISGHVFTPSFQYRIELEIGPAGFELHDFAFYYRPCSHFAVTFGQFPVQFSQHWYHYPYEILFSDLAMASSYFAPGYDLGVRLHFYQWEERVFQELSVFNGGGLNALSNDNVDLLYQVRAGVLPLGPVPEEEGDFRRGDRPPRLRFAAGYFFLPMATGRNLDGKEGMDTSWVHQAAAELSLWWRGFFLNGEFYYRHEDRGAAVTQLAPPEERRLNRFGGFAQAAYYFRPIRLAIAGRYSYADPVAFWRRNGDALIPGWRSPLAVASATALTGDGQPEAVQEVTAGLLFFAFRRNLKLSLSYTWLYEQGYQVEGRATAPSRQGHLLTLTGQARF